MPSWVMESIPLFPLNTVLFPGGHLPLQVFELRYLDMVGKCIAADRPFGVVALLDGAEVRQPERLETLSDVGTLARVRDWAAPMSGLLHAECVGERRFRVIRSERLKNGLWTAEVEVLEPDQAIAIPVELQDTADALGGLIRALQDGPQGAQGLPFAAPLLLDECGWVANRWCELLPIERDQRQRLLMQDNPVLRLELIQDMLAERGMLG
ncbi:LON peptidase substrate-binding domain-containing protein [Janthinobacterium sp.]|uniref:LON peptidase substrate-binding domain-containing protein n=1 Tax=Janthinobacterium sp. TaxID=1871054 RepID=UPI00293D4E08|nr:LON peptidase substrate-binding domain-containing protein [Janthinobacterium sp.]